MNKAFLFLACALVSSAVARAAGAVRITAEHVWTHAKAHMERNEPEVVALDLASLRLFSERPKHDVRPIEEWLAARARERKAAALAALRCGDRTQAEALYASAVQSDSTLMREDDHGLDATCDRALNRRAAEPGRRGGYALGFHYYQRSDLSRAEVCFRGELARETDMYWRWVAGLWLADITALRAVETARDDRDRSERRQRAVAASAEAERVLASQAERAAERAAAAAAETADIELTGPADKPEPADPEAPVTETGGRRRSTARAVVGLDGKPVDGVVVLDHWGQQIMVGPDGKAQGIVRNGRVVVGFDGKPVGVAVP